MCFTGRGFLGQHQFGNVSLHGETVGPYTVFIFRRENEILARRFHCGTLPRRGAYRWLFERLQAMLEGDDCATGPACSECRSSLRGIQNGLRTWFEGRYKEFVLWGLELEEEAETHC